MQHRLAMSEGILRKEVLRSSIVSIVVKDCRWSRIQEEIGEIVNGVWYKELEGGLAGGVEQTP